MTSELEKAYQAVIRNLEDRLKEATQPCVTGLHIQAKVKALDLPVGSKPLSPADKETVEDLLKVRCNRNPSMQGLHCFIEWDFDKGNCSAKALLEAVRRNEVRGIAHDDDRSDNELLVRDLSEDNKRLRFDTERLKRELDVAIKIKDEIKRECDDYKARVAELEANNTAAGHEIDHLAAELKEVRAKHERILTGCSDQQDATNRRLSDALAEIEWRNLRDARAEIEWRKWKVRELTRELGDVRNGNDQLNANLDRCAEERDEAKLGWDRDARLWAESYKVMREEIDKLRGREVKLPPETGNPDYDSAVSDCAVCVRVAGVAVAGSGR